MNWIKLIAFVIVISALTVLAPAVSAFAASKVIPWYTPPSGGAGYILGAGLASLTKKYVQGVEVVVEPTAGTLEMVRRLRERQGMKREAFAQIGSPDAYDAFKGQKGFAGKAVYRHQGNDIFVRWRCTAWSCCATPRSNRLLT